MIVQLRIKHGTRKIEYAAPGWDNPQPLQVFEAQEEGAYHFSV